MERRYTQSLLTSRAQIEATINLFAMTPVNAGLPLMGGWAASPDVLITLINELLRLKPVQVVECGSGVSTLWLALTIRRANLSTRVVALEHDPRFASATVETLKRHDVADLVDVRVAPLTAVPISGHPTPWYDCKALNDLHDVGLVFVDGPPTGTGVLARFPAVPLLFERLASPCTIILDDFVRSDEKTIAGKWRELLQDFSYDEMHDLEKGAAIFRRGT
jgi:hypothetical protein